MTSRTSHAKSGRCRGFTLVELLLVIILIGIISVAAVPNLGRSYRHLEVEETGRQIAALAQYGRERAILDEMRYALYLDRSRDEAWLCREERGEDGIATFRALGSSESRRSWLQTVSLAEVVPDPGREKLMVVYFAPDGGADAVQLVFANLEGERCTVAISPVRLTPAVELSGRAE